MSWILFAIAFSAAALGLLTVVKAPEWLPWRFAVLAGEFGHVVVLVPLAVGIAAWAMNGSRGPLSVATLGLSLLAVVLLRKPSVQARRIARSLPGKLERQFGRVDMGRTAFSAGAVFNPAPEPVRVETLACPGDLLLDLYRPERNGPGAAPCVIVVHGGGWDSGDRGQMGHFNHALARRGFAVAAISYRLAPKFVWPAQRDDLLAAIAFLKAQAAPLGIDPARLVLFGRSAGGNLAEAVAYGTPDPAIRGVVALYAPADLHFAWAYAREDDILKSPLLMRQFLGGPPDLARAAFDEASGFLHVGKTSPPTLLIHGALDTLVWHLQSVRLDRRLSEAGVPHLFMSLPWATHAFEFNLNGPGGQLTAFAVEWFIDSVTR